MVAAPLLRYQHGASLHGTLAHFRTRFGEPPTDVRLLQKGMYAMIAVCTGLAIWCTVMVLVERRKKTVVFDATVPDEGGLVEIQPHDAKGEMVMMPDP